MGRACLAWITLVVAQAVAQAVVQRMEAVMLDLALPLFETYALPEEYSMNYAVVENGLVVNILVGLPEGLDGIAVDQRPVAIGDCYHDGIFTHEGEPVLTDAERVVKLEAALAEIQEALNG